jgi:hypothetical protein
MIAAILAGAAIVVRMLAQPQAACRVSRLLQENACLLARCQRGSVKSNTSGCHLDSFEWLQLKHCLACSARQPLPGWGNKWYGSMHIWGLLSDICCALHQGRAGGKQIIDGHTLDGYRHGNEAWHANEPTAGSSF